MLQKYLERMQGLGRKKQEEAAVELTW